MLEQWESQQGPSSPAQTSMSAPVIPHSAPFPTHHLHRASVPDSASEALALAKPDPYDLYEKSRAIYESRRKYQSWCSDKEGGLLMGRWSGEDLSLFLFLSQTKKQIFPLVLLLLMSSPLLMPHKRTHTYSLSLCTDWNIITSRPSNSRLLTS